MYIRLVIRRDTDRTDNDRYRYLDAAQPYTLFLHTHTMSSHRDSERIIAADEREPLLAGADAHADARSYSSVPPERDDEPEVPEEETVHTWQYVWRGLLALFAILIIVVFVKAWIEADDVDVRIT
jgi:hypothetical protein